MRALAQAALEITLVDRANHQLFQPLLYQVATAGLSAGDIAAPLRHILRGQRNVTVRLGEATDIDLAARVFFLICFRNRFTVLVNWAWAYCTYQRHARVVFGREAEN